MSYRHLFSVDAEQFVTLADRAIGAAREVGEPVSEAFAQVWRGLLEIAQGQPELARTRLEETLRRVVASGGGMALPATSTGLAEAHAAVGDLEAAKTVLEVVVTSGADLGYFLARALGVLAEVLRCLDDLDGADQRARESLEISRRVGSPMLTSTCQEVLGRVAMRRGEWAQAEALLHDALEPRARLNLRLYLPQNLDALAEVAWGLESPAEAVRLLAAADAARAHLGLVRWPPDEPRVAALKDELRASLGPEEFGAAEAEGAATSLEEAIAWVRRSRGTRKRPSIGWASLTPTEVQVAELVAQGLTNPEVGERMFITRATVKTHLAHIFRKLELTNRAELTAFSVRREG